MTRRIELPKSEPMDIIGDNQEHLYYCNRCGRELIPLKSGFWECGNCVIRFEPAQMDVRHGTEIDTLDDGGVLNNEPNITTIDRPDLEQKKVEYRGGLKALRDKGFNITSYQEGVG